MKMNLRLNKHSLKIFSVLLSIFIWVYVLNSERVTFEKTVSVEYILPQGMAFSSPPLKEVTFLIDGPRAFVRSILDREDKVVLNLNKPNFYKASDFLVNVDSTQFKLPFGVLIDEIRPSKVSISLEKVASKILPIKPVFFGSLPNNMTIKNFELYPAEIEIVGPRTEIIRLKELVTRPIDLEGLIGLKEVPVELQLTDERFSLASNLDIRLRFDLKASTPNLILRNIPIRYFAENSMVLSPIKSATLKLLIPEKMKNRHNVSSSVQVWADIPEGAKGKVEVPLKAIIPPGVHQLEIIPKTIIVNVP